MLIYVKQTVTFSSLYDVLKKQLKLHVNGNSIQSKNKSLLANLYVYIVNVVVNA